MQDNKKNKRLRVTYEEFINRVNKTNFKCLVNEKQYIGVNYNYEFVCSNGHNFISQYHKLKNANYYILPPLMKQGQR